MAALPRRCATFAGGPPARRGRVDPRRQGRRGDAARAPAAVRRRSSSPQSANPRALPPGDARVARRPGRRAAGADGREPAPRARRARASWRARTASCSPPARSTCSPTCCARRARAGGRCCERRRRRRVPAMIALVAIVVALVILVFFGLGYGSADCSSNVARLPLARRMLRLAVFGIDNDGLNTGRQAARSSSWSSSGSRSSTGPTPTRAAGSPTRCSSAAATAASPVPVRGDDRLHDRAPARVPRRRARARARDAGRRGAPARERLPALPALRPRTSRRTSCAARTACASSRTRARTAASRSTRSGRSARTARPRCPGTRPVPRRRRRRQATERGRAGRDGVVRGARHLRDPLTNPRKD